MSASHGDRATRRIGDVDLATLAEALEEHSGDVAWWYDPATGQLEPYSPWWTEDDESEDPLDRGLVRVESDGSRWAYRDMEHFAEAVANPHMADVLDRALGGRGAFRRFRDALSEDPRLQAWWEDFARAERENRAIGWLVEENLVDERDARTERARREVLIAEILDAVASTGGIEVDARELPARWGDVTTAIDTASTVTVVRDGRPWAIITAFNRSDAADGRAGGDVPVPSAVDAVRADRDVR